MAHFRGTLVGNRGDTSRLGSKSSGIHATVRGWDIGADVSVVNTEDGGHIELRITNGSHGCQTKSFKRFRFKNEVLEEF